MAFTEKYVTTTGTEAWSTNSYANPSSLAEAVANAAAGERVNIAHGTYTLAGTLTLPAGAAENPIEWRGYRDDGSASDIGNLEHLGRATPTGELVKADFPLIDAVTFGVSTGAFNTLKNLRITSDLNGTLVGIGNASTMYRCEVYNTSVGSAVSTVNIGTNYGSIHDCDLVTLSTGSAAYGSRTGRGSITGCRIWNTSSSAVLGRGVYVEFCGVVSQCLIFNFGTGVEITGSANACCQNTIFDVVTGIEFTSANSAVVSDNIVYQASGYGIGGTSANVPLLVNNAIGAYTSGRFNTSGLGSIIEEQSPIELTADPFVDSAGEDFRLNGFAGGGKLCRAASSLWGGFGDVGAVQHEDGAQTIAAEIPDLAGHWEPSIDTAGNGTTTLTDLTANANNGTLTNMDAATDWVVDTAFDGEYALDFDGTNDRVDCGDDDVFSFGDGFADSGMSLSFWAKADTTTSGYMVAKWDSTNGREYFVSLSSGNLIARFYDHSVGSYIGRQFSGFTDGAWNHVCVCYDGSGTEGGIGLFVNGVEAGVSSSGGGGFVAMENGTSTLCFGNREDGTAPFDGRLDAIRLYSRLLSAEQREALGALRPGRSVAAVTTTTAPAVETVSSGVFARSASDTASINLPSGITAGDLLVLLHSNDDPSGSMCASVAGFNLIWQNDTADGADLWVRVADGTEGATVTATFDAVDSEGSSYICLRISNPGVCSINGSREGSVVAATANPALPVAYRSRTENCLWLGIFQGYANTVTDISGTPSGWTVAATVSSAGFDTPNISIVYKTEATESQTGQETWTINSATGTYETLIVSVAAQQQQAGGGGGVSRRLAKIIGV